jgi:hypothetical protein
MSENVERIHKQISELSFGDLLLLAGNAVNMPMDEERIDLILKYVEIALTLRKINK